MADKTRRIEALKHQIAKLQEEARMIESWGDSVRALDSFTTEEKAKIFDELYKQAREYLQSCVEDGWRPKDGDYYLYEAVMRKMLGKNVWGIINSI
jgi:hypothetical protein